jgi:hypothetical protein
MEGQWQCSLSGTEPTSVLSLEGKLLTDVTHPRPEKFSFYLCVLNCTQGGVSS